MKVLSVRLSPWSKIIAQLSIALVMLLVIPVLVFAQGTGPPAPPEPVIYPQAGAIIIQPVYPAVPPPSCVGPLTGNGAIAVIPPQQVYGDNVIAVVNAQLDGERLSTLLVPLPQSLQGSTIIVRIISVSTAELSAELPSWVSHSIAAFDIDLCVIAPDGTQTFWKAHDPPMTFGIKVMEGEDPNSLVLLRYDESLGQYQVLETTFVPDTNALSAVMHSTARFVEVAIKPGETIPPSGLPTTGGGIPESTVRMNPWLVVGLAIFLLLGGTSLYRYARQSR